MVHLYSDDPHTAEGYIRWSIELLKRGLNPSGEIEVHGPHPQTPRMWGETECDCIHGGGFNVVFETSETHDIYSIRGLKVQDRDSGERFAVIPDHKRPKDLTKKINDLKKQLAEFST